MDVFVQLPLHVKNWVCHYTRKNIDQDIVKLPLRHDHPFSSLIISLLERRDFPSARDHAFNLIISLPDENRWRGGYPDARYHHYEIPQDKSRYLTEFFESLMQKELFDRLDMCEKYNLKYKDEINFFIEKYQCEGAVLNYESLKKKYYRYRQSDRQKSHPLMRFF